MLEAEEEREKEREAEREGRGQEEEHAKRQADQQADKERKLAQREMQKKMGKALLRNFADARDKAEKEKAEMLASPTSAAPSPITPNRTLKPKKSVSFANVPDVDVEKPKLEKERKPVTLGDVSIGILQGNSKRVRLKKDELANLPMKLEVIERVPGSSRTAGANSQASAVARDSDDESVQENPEEKEHSDLSDDDIPESDDNSDESDADDLDNITQSQMQREIALEYIKKRELINSRTDHAFTSHDHDPIDDWDVPVSACLF